MVTVQVEVGGSVVPQVVVERKGHWLVILRTASGRLAEELVSVSVLCAVWPEATWPKMRTLLERDGPVKESEPAPMP